MMKPVLILLLSAGAAAAHPGHFDPHVSGEAGLTWAPLLLGALTAYGVALGVPGLIARLRGRE